MLEQNVTFLSYWTQSSTINAKKKEKKQNNIFNILKPQYT